MPVTRLTMLSARMKRIMPARTARRFLRSGPQGLRCRQVACTPLEEVFASDAREEHALVDNVCSQNRQLCGTSAV